MYSNGAVNHTITELVIQQTVSIHRTGRDCPWLQFNLAPHTLLIMPFSGYTGLAVHLHGLTGLRKAACESKLGYLYQYAWCAWTVQECSVNVRLYINWISVVLIRMVLAETVT